MRVFSYAFFVRVFHARFLCVISVCVSRTCFPCAFLFCNSCARFLCVFPVPVRALLRILIISSFALRKGHSSKRVLFIYHDVPSRGLQKLSRSTTTYRPNLFIIVLLLHSYDLLHLRSIYNHTSLNLTEAQWRRVQELGDWIEYGKYGPGIVGSISGGILANEIAAGFQATVNSKGKAKVRNDDRPVY